ncbi:tyrosine-protein phosphatase [Paenibacillus sp. TRM 82003]|uniref:tyrosine-protein phosphatase n=1 Tax=Kineococcus sp. TRM81007 TaxID=2925831 RepID=UPI001F587BDC|nr:tyrosine-protein phosphatase [Kineococcus sp. TRM81007]MCI2238224.1 tyrosine-protein phosphatase [Kineococcus sp. TRM81007]MCI3924104.1 tyrosine-protein phosphatase [Paenibacillus sp. TRM 82003]
MNPPHRPLDPQLAELMHGAPGPAAPLEAAGPEPVETVANLRDVAHCDPRLEPGVLWRSAQPLAGDGAPAQVTSWPPATVVDLRSAAELPAGDHPLLGEGTRVHPVELLDGAGDPAAAAGDPPPLREVYLGMLEPGTGLLRAVELVAAGPAPVLVHCAAGKDRTGVVVALALRLVDVPRTAVLADFALTTGHLPEVLRRLVAASPLPTGVDLATLPQEYFTAPTAALDAVLDVWDAHEGGAAGWARAHGASADLPERLSALLRRV